MDENSIVRRSLTRQEFCFKKRISPSTFHKLKRQGLGPKQDYLGRIPPEAEDAWDELMASLAESEAAKLEAARRRAQAAEAGKIAAASPRHISRRSHSTGRRRDNAGGARGRMRG
jgi:catalase (peroxidase I)